jgi:hypothetical protein
VPRSSAPGPAIDIRLVVNGVSTAGAWVYAVASGENATLAVHTTWLSAPAPGLGWKGGTTIGNAFLTSKPLRSVMTNSALLGHESEHASQWAWHGGGLLFLAGYGTASGISFLTTGDSACGNPYEEGAGFTAGGYSC